MTYAELYGNIKKRPLKCGLGNKMISEIGVNALDVESRLGLGKIAQVGDVMSKFNEVTSPLNSIRESIASQVDGTLLGIDSLTCGMKNALSISNYR